MTYAASLSACYIATSCSTGELNLFGTSDTENAHAYLNPDDGAYRVCCSGTNISTNNTNNSYTDIVVRLDQANNSHAQEDSLLEPEYPEKVYISSNDTSNATCIYTSTGNCSIGFTCVVKLSDINNAHVYNCSTETTNETVCCGFSPPQGGAIPEFANHLLIEGWDVIKKIVTFQKIE